MVVRALGGSMARKLRAVLPDLGLKGEKAVVTEVRYLVSIVGGIFSLVGLLVSCLAWSLLGGFRCCSLAEVWFAEMEIG